MLRKPKQGKVKPEPALLGMRTHDDRLQTAVNTFQHPDGRTVTIVGIEHIGEEDYYAQLRKTVDETAAAGAHVRLESLRDKDDKAAARNDTEIAGLDALNQQLGNRFKVFDALGLNWVGQHASAMKRDPSWIVSDVRAIEMVRLQGPVHLTQIPQLTAPQQQLDLVEALKKKRALRRLRVIRSMLVAQAIGRGEMVQTDRLHTEWWERQTVYAWRECVEALKILEQDGDVTAIWNAAHMRGLSEPLLRNEFILVNSQWFTAIRKPDPSTPIPLHR